MGCLCYTLSTVERESHRNKMPHEGRKLGTMAEKITATTLSNALREEVTVGLIAYLTEQGLTVGKRASGKLLFEKPDVTGEDRWVQVDVIVPKGSREGEPFDGQALIDEYIEKQALAEAKAVERERVSKERQAKRAEKDKAKADAKAKAEAEAESAG